MTPAPFVILKFGGTSVSSARNWKTVLAVVRDRLGEGFRPVVVHSALTGVTDLLETLLERAARGEHETVLAEIARRHRDLAAELGLTTLPELERCLNELDELAARIAARGTADDDVRADVLARGELMATRLGAAYLRTQDLDVTWIDARTLLSSETRPHATARSNFLSATCAFEPDPDLQRRLSGERGVILTQGFIASDERGRTVVLGRGGSDTSAAYLAAKLEARRLEIWTDVPGMFSADPRMTPTARLLTSLDYDEAQEIASNGAAVLHPRCILPLRQYGIPLHLRSTLAPHLQGTVIAGIADGGAQVKAIAMRKGITLISMESTGMWHQVGFLADAFQVFKTHGLSLDLVSTSETNVTVSLDPGPNALDAEGIDALVADLSRLCRVNVIGPAASVSLLGRNIRGILHRLGDAFELFEEQKIYLVSQAANDLNFTFVIDESQADRLVRELHELLIHATPSDGVMGPTWEQLHAAPATGVAEREPWWRKKRSALLELGRRHGAAFAYDGETVDERIASLLALRSVARVLYAMKANPHPEILRRVAAAGLSFDCVSQGELERVLDVFPDLDRRRILFTPNFAPRSEYAFALDAGVWVTVDNLHPLREWPDLFEGREILVRLDPGRGRGHHGHVRTAGARSKFGLPVSELDELVHLARRRGTRIVGLHAHAGSGIFDVRNWSETARTLAALAGELDDVRILDIGGGIGVPERPGQPPLDLGVLDAALGGAARAAKAGRTPLEIWLEPGRFIVAEAGVLLAQVTQLKQKGDVRYIGVATGMNSLIRPALYGAHHEIVNLSRLGEPATETFNVVGPICESGDQLGADRLLPRTLEGDILLIANAGAYGRAMSSSYNLRPPAEEFVL